MKRPVEEDSSSSDPDSTNKKVKPGEPDPDQAPDENGSATFVLADEDLLHEVLKRTDARTVAASACVSRLWRRTATDERLWELICARHWAGSGSGSWSGQLRSLVLALGGFRSFHSLYVLPLAKTSVPSTAATASAWPCLPLPAKPPAAAGKGKGRWGKDEMHLSLSLLSIRYFEKMNFSNRGK